MTAMRLIAVLTVRECFRRPFPYVLAAAVLFLALASRLLLAFAFGAEAAQTADLAVSAVFLAGFGLAAFVGTGLVRRDLERGTLGFLLAKPVDLPAYLAGRFLGLVAASAALGAAVGCVLLWALWMLAPVGAFRPLDVAPDAAASLLPVVMLQAAALALSAILPRTAAPPALVAVFVAGTLGGGGAAGWFAPDFALFAPDGAIAAAPGLATLYTAVFSSIFLLAAYIFLASRRSLRSEG